MCISNRIGAGLMSNAVWQGVPLRTLLEAAGAAIGRGGGPPQRRRRLHRHLRLREGDGPDHHRRLRHERRAAAARHGYPARVVVPGLYGEKNVKWVTRIEVVDHDAKGFYEQQGWGPDFVIPTRSRFYEPDLSQPIRSARRSRCGGSSSAATRGSRGPRSASTAARAGARPSWSTPARALLGDLALRLAPRGARRVLPGGARLRRGRRAAAGRGSRHRAERRARLPPRHPPGGGLRWRSIPRRQPPHRPGWVDRADPAASVRRRP